MEIRAFFKKYRIVFLILLIVDIIVPDPIPFVDEVVLGLATIYGFI